MNASLYYYDTAGSPTTSTTRRLKTLNTAWYHDTAGPPITLTSNVSGSGTHSSSTPRTQPRPLRSHCSGRLQGHPGWQHCAERLPLHRCTGAPHLHPARPGTVQHELLQAKHVTNNTGHQPLQHTQPQHWKPSSPTPRLGCTRTWQPWEDEETNTVTSGNSSTA